MNCEQVKKNLHRWLDRELAGDMAGDLAAHVTACPVCSKELELLRRLNILIRAPQEGPEISPSFGPVFWQKVAAREKEPWLEKWLVDLEAWIPTLSLAQAAAVLVFALLLGGTGGVLSAVQASEPFKAKDASLHYLSGFREFKGVPFSSVAGTYLSAAEGERRS